VFDADIGRTERVLSQHQQGNVQAEHHQRIAILDRLPNSGRSESDVTAVVNAISDFAVWSIRPIC
jgi:hypothetical protein